MSDVKHGDIFVEFYLGYISNIAYTMVRVHSDATSDLLGIKTVDPTSFYRLVAFIEQLKCDSRLIANLLDHGFGDDKNEPISVKKWINIHNVERLPVWRMRAWNLEKQGLMYRLIYCYHWPDKSYNIMAIVHRGKLNYDDPNDPIRKRVTTRVKEEFPRA